MRHFWVFETLLDLREHALDSGFPRLAQKLQEAIWIAYVEIDPTDPKNAGPSRRPEKRGM